MAIDFAADIPVFLDTFGWPVTFWDSGYRVDTLAIDSVTDPVVSPFDGTISRPQTLLAVAAADVEGISTKWKVDWRGKRYPVIDINRADAALFVVTLGEPE